MYKILVILAGVSILSACVSPMALNDQSPKVSYDRSNKLLISVVDERKRVKDGKPKEFIGTAHASFGIPVSWHVKHILSTESDDKKRNLSDWLEHRIVNGLNNKGWKSESINLDNGESDLKISEIIKNENASGLIKLTLNEWYFSLNLNWVSAFNFDTDTLVEVYDLSEGKTLNKVFKERDVIEESASESPQNNVLRAYRDQLQQILNDKDVMGVLAENMQ